MQQKKNIYIYILKYWIPSNNIEQPRWDLEPPAASFSSSSSPPLLFICPFFLRSFTFCFAQTPSCFLFHFLCFVCLLCMWLVSFHVWTMSMSKTNFLTVWTMSMSKTNFLTVWTMSTKLWIFWKYFYYCFEKMRSNLFFFSFFFYIYILNVLRSIYLNIKVNSSVFIFFFII